MQDPVRSVLVQNETTKLIANAFDRASTGFAVGAVLPLFNGWRTMTQGSGDWRAEGWILVFSATAYISIAAMSHWIARRTFGDLREAEK